MVYGNGKMNLSEKSEITEESAASMLKLLLLRDSSVFSLRSAYFWLWLIFDNARLEFRERI